MKGWAGVVLAAGKGVRMKSRIPKVLHPICGKEMIRYPIDVLKAAGIEEMYVVISPENEKPLREALGESVRYVLQKEQLGTGHAVSRAASQIKEVENIVVINGDAPLIKVSTAKDLLDRFRSTKASLAFLSSRNVQQQGLGRVQRDSRGRIVAIVEAAETRALGGEQQEVNAGLYCFQTSWLWEALPKLQKSSRGEYYLTSLVSIAASSGQKVEAFITTDPTEALGINDRKDLALVESVMRQRIRDGWMEAGVTIVDPESTFIDASVTIGQDTAVHPNTMLLKNTVIGEECVIGPGSLIEDSRIGNRCKVWISVVEGAVVEDGTDVGPFSHLRPGAYLESGVHIGNYAEVKKSRLGRGVAMGHFSYVGDATIGANVNIGAGTITCNYDGVRKNRTVIEDGAFIGSDTMLVAPVKVGEGAVTGAGAVVTKDVPPRTLAVGVPARVIKTLETSSQRTDTPTTEGADRDD